MQHSAATRAAAGLGVAVLAVGIGACNKGGDKKLFSPPAAQSQSSQQGGGLLTNDSTSSFAAPSFDIPSYSAPSFSAPSFSVPSVPSLPDLPSASSALGGGGDQELDSSVVIPDLSAAGVVPPSAKPDPSGLASRTSDYSAQSFTGVTTDETITYLKSQGWSVDRRDGDGDMWLKRGEASIVVKDNIGGSGVRLQYFPH